MEIILIVLDIMILIGLGWLIINSKTQKRGSKSQKVLLDTSAIIDGRVEEIAAAGFIPSLLLVPQFVIAELQHIADSSNELRRARGRFGLEMVKKLQAMNNLEIRVVSDSAPKTQKVDDKLVAMAARSGAAIMTTDFNLNKVAAIHNVRVLNVNELAHGLRPIVLPGEQVSIKLVQRGSDPRQGVGYLEDGTMVVVDRADRLIGKEVTVSISRIMQTVAGKMLFATLVRKTDNKSQLPASSSNQKS